MPLQTLLAEAEIVTEGDTPEFRLITILLEVATELVTHVKAGWAVIVHETISPLSNEEVVNLLLLVPALMLLIVH